MHVCPLNFTAVTMKKRKLFFTIFWLKKIKGLAVQNPIHVILLNETNRKGEKEKREIEKDQVKKERFFAMFKITKVEPKPSYYSTIIGVGTD